MSDPFAEFDALLQELERQRERQAERVEPRARSGVKARARRWLLVAVLVCASLVLPFYVLVASSVFVYRSYGVPTWPALLVGVLLTALLLLVYASWVGKRITGSGKVSSNVTKVIFAIVGAYALYALIYLSSMNVKHEEVRGEYRSLHPLLRVATSTFILLDNDLVITDMQRQLQDYEAMGLPVYERSLHLEQSDGYAHAVDLRTLGRSAWRNYFTEAYFRAMGFRTLRHVGTADHLHVSLPMPNGR